MYVSGRYFPYGIGLTCHFYTLRLIASTRQQNPRKCLLERSRNYKLTSWSLRSSSRWSLMSETMPWWWACSGKGEGCGMGLTLVWRNHMICSIEQLIKWQYRLFLCVCAALGLLVAILPFFPGIKKLRNYPDLLTIIPVGSTNLGRCRIVKPAP